MTGGLVVIDPGSALQVLISMIICLLSMRVYSGYKPFIDDLHDLFAEIGKFFLRIHGYARLVAITTIE